MSKPVTFCIFSHSGKPIRQFCVPRPVVFGLLSAAAVLAVGLGYLLTDYAGMRTTLGHMAVLESRVVSQQDEISLQRHQIRDFAEKINEFTTRLAELDAFETRIRTIANLKEESGQDGIFGMGGPLPDDLDAQIDPERKHNSLLRDMHATIDRLDAATDQQADGLKDLFDSLEAKVNLLASTPSIRPVNGGWVSSRFGYRKSPFTGAREFHKGLDIATREKEPIVATADGRIAYVGKKGLLGNVVVIDHGHGIVTRYGHIKKALKKAGDTVKRGDAIALVGNTGRSTGPHVHYEVILNGASVNPRKYILN